MLKFKKTDEKAVIPTKSGENEVGYDLTAIKFEKLILDNVYLFNTGIKVEPPPGFYVEIVPRSSIIKTGYLLANNTGIIDPTYRGNLKIALLKTSKMCNTLITPFTLCQLIIRPMYSFNTEIVDELTHTDRGEGGFGSTNK